MHKNQQLTLEPKTFRLKKALHFALLSSKSALPTLLFHMEAGGMKKAHGRKRIRENEAFLSSQDRSQAGHWQCPCAFFPAQVPGSRSDLLSQGIWISESLCGWFCCAAMCWRLCPVPGTLSLGFPVGGVGGSSGPAGCYEAGHGAESQGF